MVGTAIEFTKQLAYLQVDKTIGFNSSVCIGVCAYTYSAISSEEVKCITLVCTWYSWGILFHFIDDILVMGCCT